MASAMLFCSLPVQLPATFPFHHSSSASLLALARSTTSSSWTTFSPPVSKSLPLAAGKGFGHLLPQRQPKTKPKDAHTSQHNVCPCGGGGQKLDYSQCCEPYHLGEAVVPDGLSLLKARYSAYARGAVDFVVKTTHPKNPDFKDNLVDDVVATCARIKYYKLDIMHCEVVNDNESYVSFSAVYGLANGGRGERQVLEERSYFVREGDAWLFMDGTPLTQASQAAWLMSSTPSYVEANDAKKAATGFKPKSKLNPRKV